MAFCLQTASAASTRSAAARSPLFLRRQAVSLLSIAVVLFSVFFSGCAKHPASTSPVGVGKAGGQAICKTARANIGVRYKMGGTTPSTGFDCSGFLRWTFAQHGIDLPRTAREQMRVGVSVDRNKLRPGDIVGFKTTRRVFHTGLYIGNGKFVHSPSSGKTIREDSMSDSYWRKRFVTARRLPQVR